MTFLAVIVCIFALYGFLMLAVQLFGHRPLPDTARFGGVVDASTDQTLGYLPPELRAIERRVLAARATT